MKTVAILSVVTFVLIFGGVLFIGAQLEDMGEGEALPELAPEDYEAAERVFADMALERDRIQREQENLVLLRQDVAVQEGILEESRQRLETVISRLEDKQQTFVAEREKSAARLAKMYEAMKPDQAAPIIGSLEMEIVLEIMSRMKERAAARILARMDPGYAAQISTHLSARGSRS